jgi:hypothetical protein
MEHPNLSQSNLVMDEVNVNLDMLCATVMDRVSCHIDSANIVAVDNSRLGDGRVKIL